MCYLRGPSTGLPDCLRLFSRPALLPGLDLYGCLALPVTAAKDDAFGAPLRVGTAPAAEGGEAVACEAMTLLASLRHLSNEWGG